MQKSILTIGDNLFKIVSLREKWVYLRFQILLKFRTLKIVDNTMLADTKLFEYSKKAVINYKQIPERINFLLSMVENSVRSRDQKILIIGPRYESEIYGLYGLGFKRSNILAIDSISYSKKIIVGDMHNTTFPDNSFDLVIAGWVLAYSKNHQKAMNEIFRIIKNNGLVIISGDISDYQLPIDFSKIHIQDSNISIESLCSNFEIFQLTLGKTCWNSNSNIMCLALKANK